ncbi:CFEM domain protein [Metarhizium rileyi]|uniref:CFEM domain protein n=1 Tax=Metarhizium rileyi (strain RCEF 4871) TaxID=1649241 RepID=A0A166WSR0_METRR|nr:CFEM domain protein [Metarhizium rileyi RCEF 4871]
MGRLFPLFLGVFSTLHILGVSAQAPPACIETCTNEVRNKFSDLKCQDASAAPCFCTNPVFSSAILECSKSQCGATADSVFAFLSAGFCAGQPLGGSGIAANPSSPTSHTTTSSAAPETTTASPPPSSATQTATPTSTSSDPTSTVVETTGSSTASPAPSSTSDNASSATSNAPSSATSSVAATGGSPSTGLSQAAIAGIGVGIGAAVIAVAGIVVCMLLKARRHNPRRNGNKADISKPFHGPGRMYTREASFRRARDHSMEKYGNDLEMTSHRYEDMVPRTQPRTLV